VNERPSGRFLLLFAISLEMSGNIFSLMFNEGGQPKVNQTANSQKQKLNQTNSNP